MTTGHDQASEVLDGASEFQTGHGTIDPLSDVLRTIRLKGALMFVVDATSPWCVDIPAAKEFAATILPSARHVISYHIVVEGRGLASVPGTDARPIEAGDIVVFPHADPYVIASEPNAPPELNRDETLQFFADLAAGRLPFVVKEGGGRAPKAKFVCGFLGCDVGPFNPLLATLPRLLQIHRSGGGHGLLDRLIDLTLLETEAPQPGGDSVRLGLSELMFVESLRCYLASLPAKGTGWLSGLRDPAVGRSLAQIHADPARDWTLKTLARAAGVSRSVLADRFAATVSETPMRYLTRWRVQLAARLLADGSTNIAGICEQIGFKSQSAFSRTFKNITGHAPSQWLRSGSTEAVTRPAGSFDKPQSR